MSKASLKKQTEPEEVTLGEHVAKAEKKETAIISKAPPKAKAPNKKDDEITALRREVKALRAHQQEERKLAGEVEAAELDLEGANAERLAARERLASANKRLATFVRGEPKRDVETGSQQTMVPEKPKGSVAPLVDPTRDGAAAQKAGKALDANPWPEKAPERGLWSAGFLAAKWGKVEVRKAITYGLTFNALIDAAIPDDTLPPGEKAPQVKAITALQYQWLVLDAWKASESSPAMFAMVQLLSKDEWKDLWQKTYGPPIPGVDKSDEHKATRQLGGVDCGRIVSLGKKQYVVGPMKDASMILSWSDEDKPEKPKRSLVDHKAKAAGDDTNEPEDDEDAI